MTYKSYLYRFTLVVLCSVRWGSPGSAQDRPQEGPTFKVQSNLVVVDVTVRDKKGDLLEELRKEDFTVYEDNVPQQIVTFSRENIPAWPAPSVAGSSAGPAENPINYNNIPPARGQREGPQGTRLMILFFDLSSLSSEDLIRSVSTAEDFVSRQSTSNDLMAIVTYGSTLQLVQDLTNDREILLKTLKELSPTQAGDTPEEDLSDPGEASDDFSVPDATQFNIFNSDRRLSALKTLAKTYREFPERKSLIYFSSGLQTTGIENQSQIRSAVDAANRSNMSIYTVDSRGLVALPPGGDASSGSPGGRALFSGSAMQRQTANLSNSQETLTTLAHDTGGAAFQDTNDLAAVFTRVISDSRSYYILGYYSSNTKEDGRFRKVRVAVRSPEVKVQNRPGYFATKQFQKLTQAEKDEQLEEAFNVEQPFSDLPFILQADYFKEDGTRSIVPVSLQLAGDGIQFEEKGNQREARFEFLARISERSGRVAGVARDTVEVRLPVQTAEKIRSGQILYTTGFELRPGDYALKFLIRDNRSGRFGTFEQPLVVPPLDGKSLQTSSIVLGSRLVDPQANAQGVEHRGYGDRFKMLGVKRDPLVIGEKRIVPSIGNVFASRQTLYLYFQICGASEDPQTRKPSLETLVMLLQEKSKVLDTQPQLIEQWEQGNKGTADVAMALPLRGLKKGTYSLQVHVRDNVSDTNLFRRIPVVIE